ncbi:MAG: 4-hydroxybenzoate octaprenyltransferase [Planctomycetota bacterium]|nr:4-hydroxybenzoate octaprenyltransferase [Planctomycetota bacterium]
MTGIDATNPDSQAVESSLFSRLRLAALDIKLAHSVFALPFALLGAALAILPGTSPGQIAVAIILVVWCMVFARSWAMLVNRVADASIDAQNPRTTRRAVASGRLSRRDAWRIALGSAGLFLVGCAGFWLTTKNHWPLLLGVPVLLWIAGYSYTKRFTALCHFVLGASLAISPLAAAIALNPAAVGLDPNTIATITPKVPGIFWLALMVLTWVAGFDVIYALQDEDFDRSRRLHSVPAAIGWRAASWVSRALHVVAWLALYQTWRTEPRMDVLFAIAVALVAGLLIFQHFHLTRRGKAGLEMAFFTANGIVSCIVGVLGISDLFV